MKSFIKNFVEIKENGLVVGLSLDLEKAEPLELNIYTAYLSGRLTADDVISPPPWLKVSDWTVVGHGTFHDEIVVRDFVGNLSEYGSLANLHNITSISVGEGYIARIMDIKYGAIVEKDGFQDCVGYGQQYTTTGVLAFIKYCEKQDPTKMASLLKSLKDSGQKLDIIFS